MKFTFLMLGVALAFLFSVCLTPKACYADSRLGLKFAYWFGSEGSNPDSLACKDRDKQKRFGILISGSDDALAGHLAWYLHQGEDSWHDGQRRRGCSLDNLVIGIGGRATTEDIDDLKANDNDFYLAGEVGLSYHLNKTYRNESNVQLYTAVDVGAGDDDAAVELGILNYGGFLYRDHGIPWITVGGVYRNYSEKKKHIFYSVPNDPEPIPDIPVIDPDPDPEPIIIYDCRGNRNCNQ